MIQDVVAHTVCEWIKMCLSVIKPMHTRYYDVQLWLGICTVHPCRRVSDITFEACNQAALSVFFPPGEQISYSHIQHKHAKQHFINHTNRPDMHRLHKLCKMM